MNSSDALCLLSGGLDSTVAMLMAKEQGIKPVWALTYHYGQRASIQEGLAAQKTAQFLGAEHTILTISHFSLLSRQGLLNLNSALPKLTDNELDNVETTTKSAASVWVPNRNGVLIEIAASFAEDRKIPYLIVGFNREEAATFPDNSKNYLDAINHALSFSTQNKVKVISPTLNLSKTEIVKKALDLEFPLEFLWSCYEAQVGLKMCGRCESCMRLKRALKNNGANRDSLFEI